MYAITGHRISTAIFLQQRELITCHVVYRIATKGLNTTSNLCVFNSKEVGFQFYSPSILCHWKVPSVVSPIHRIHFLDHPSFQICSAVLRTSPGTTHQLVTHGPPSNPASATPPKKTKSTPPSRIPYINSPISSLKHPKWSNHEW